MERIQVGYSPIGITGDSKHHKFILYTTSDGDSYQIHGGGSRGYGSSPSPEGSISSSPSINPDDFGFGRLRATVFKTRKPLAAEIKLETVMEGENLGIEFIKMIGISQALTEDRKVYNPLGPNSNTLADEILRISGAPAPKLDEKYSSPGSIDDDLFKPSFFSQLPPPWGKKHIVDMKILSRIFSKNIKLTQSQRKDFLVQLWNCPKKISSMMVFSDLSCSGDLKIILIPILDS